MERNSFLNYCRDRYGTEADYPFEGDSETAVLRHGGSRKWYALVMRIPKSKLGAGGGELADVVNLKLPIEMFGSFGAEDGVYPAYHMNKLHWVSVLLSAASDDTVEFLTEASFNATKAKKRRI